MKILSKETLALYHETKISKLKVSAPDISAYAKAGQFVVLIVNEEGERLPLTIVDCDKERGTITLIFQELGLSTKLLGKLNSGDSLYALAGPLGTPTEIKNFGRIILVGGGVGIAEIYPVAKAFKEAANNITVILGARTKELLILEKELKGMADELYIATDDGSYARKGFVTDILKEILTSGTNLGYSLAYAVGPLPMMRRVADITRPQNLKTIVSLNALMVDATGMCGCCRVTVGGKVKFSCVEGPEFDARLLDWDELIRRSSIYSEKEKHICNLVKLL